MKKIFPLFIIVASVFFFQCTEPSDVIYEENAKIIWTGEMDVDGCGFFIEIDTVRYKPESESVISPYFKKKKSYSVTLQYIDLQLEGEYTCRNSTEPKKIGLIKIISIALN